MGKRRRLTGAGAASIMVMGTLAGAPSAGSQEECIECSPEHNDVAFFKIADRNFPGATYGVFSKDSVAQPPAFFKLSELRFPGATQGVFSKDSEAPSPAFFKLSKLEFPGQTESVFFKQG